MLAIALGVLLALALAFILARQIALPVRRLVAATRRVQDGDYDVQIDVKSGDEIGILSQAFRSLVEDLREKAALVDYMISASGATATKQVTSLAPGMRTAVITPGGQASAPGRGVRRSVRRERTARRRGNGRRVPRVRSRAR